jgi:hypothetical protein
MKRGGGKGKGSSFERKLCKALSLWITDGARDDCLWRSAISGGRATVARGKGKLIAHQAGDVAAVHAEGHVLTDNFFIEAKHYRKLGTAAFLTSRPSLLGRFWDHAVNEAKLYQRVPMLIAKENNVPTLVLVPMIPIVDELKWVQGSLLCILARRAVNVLDYDTMLLHRFSDDGDALPGPVRRRGRRLPRTMDNRQN